MHRCAYVLVAAALFAQGCTTFDARGRTFVGEVRYSGPAAMLTTFYDEPLRGSYQYYSGVNRSWIRGTLNKCERRAASELRCWWSDPAGQGVVLFRFDRSGDRFDGSWDVGDTEDPSNTWNGTRFRP